MVSSFLAILVAVLLALGPTSILAQITSNVTCLPSFNWMTNSRSQNPCFVTAYLAGACNGGTYNVGALQPGFQYIGPTASLQNPCQCSSVLYNAVSACSLCQNATIINWSQWNSNCSTVFPGVFAPGIPSGTTVPHWAFQDVTTSDLFNVTLAQSVGDNPESTATVAQSTGSPSVKSTATSASLSSPPQSMTTSSVTPTSSGGSSDTAAIAGGVVGGVIGVLIIGVIAFFVLKKLHAPPPPPPLTEHKETVPEITSPEPAIYTDGAPFGLPEMDKP